MPVYSTHEARRRWSLQLTHRRPVFVAVATSLAAFLLGFLGTAFTVPTHAQDRVAGRTSALLLSPRSATVLEGATFDVSIFVDTDGNAINAVELNLTFPPDLLTIVEPSRGKSIISIWATPPRFSNTGGTASFAGIIPNGITTDSGLITTVTFRANKRGRAVVGVLSTSKVLANDGLGTNILSRFGRGVYGIETRPPEGVRVFSETHPFTDTWYNNNSPVLTWEKGEGVTDFSFALDNKPQTVPDNKPETTDTITSYEDLADGLWYFHIKARKTGMWGNTTHFPLRIDTTPPARFTPEVEAITATVIGRVLVSFFTTDALSGIDYYKVGVIDKTRPPSASPAFVEAKSPYQLPNALSGNLRVIVRAFDRAGNVRDESADVRVPLSYLLSLRRNLTPILIGALFLILLIFILHYFFGHHIARRLRRAFQTFEGNGDEHGGQGHGPLPPPHEATS